MAEFIDEGLILVVDDEPKLVRLVREVLTTVGFRVISTGFGKEAIELVALEKPDLILLDIVLADDVDGFKVARRVREFSDCPIVMLTAKARESDLLLGFESGADDYLTKPFSSKEMLARVRAVLKRSRHEVAAPEDTELVCGDLQVQLPRRRVLIGEREVDLSRTEYNLLLELLKNRNKVMLHEQLLGSIWGPEYRDDIDYLRAYIRYLRKKLERDPSNPRLILTCKGVGYMLVCSEEPA